MSVYLAEFLRISLIIVLGDGIVAGLVLNTSHLLSAG